MQNQADIWKPSLISGAIFGVLSGLPIVSALNCLCCSLIMSAGVLSAFLVIKSSVEPVSYGRAALAGLLSGLVATPFSWAIQLFLLVVTGTDAIEQLQDAMDQLAQVYPEMDQGADVLGSMGLAVVMIVVGMLTLALYVPFGALGGVIGRAIFERRTPVPPAAAAPPPITPSSTPQSGPPITPGSSPAS